MDLVAELITSFCLVTFLGPPGPSSLSGATSVFLWRRWTHYNGTLKGQENIRAVTIVPDSESVWYTTQDSQRYSGPRLSVTRWSCTANHFNIKLFTNLNYNSRIISSLMSGLHLFLFFGLLSRSSLLKELLCSSYCSLDILEKRTINQQILASCDIFFFERELRQTRSWCLACDAVHMHANLAKSC